MLYHSLPPECDHHLLPCRHPHGGRKMGQNTRRDPVACSRLKTWYAHSRWPRELPATTPVCQGSVLSAASISGHSRRQRARSQSGRRRTEPRARSQVLRRWAWTGLDLSEVAGEFPAHQVAAPVTTPVAHGPKRHYAAQAWYTDGQKYAPRPLHEVGTGLTGGRYRQIVHIAKISNSLTWQGEPAYPVIPRYGAGLTRMRPFMNIASISILDRVPQAGCAPSGQRGCRA